MNYLKLASQARSFKKLQDQVDIEQKKLDFELEKLGKESKKFGLVLWYFLDNNTYFWENSHGQNAKYSTLAEAILAYGTESIDFN